MASDNKVVSDVKLQKIVDKLRAIKDRQQLNEEQRRNTRSRLMTLWDK